MVNVNNWHWTEKNCSSWSIDYLEPKLEKIAFDDPITTKVSEAHVSGDVDLNQRKGKVLYFYELKVNLKLEGVSEYSGKFSGEFNVLEFSNEMDNAKDLQCSLTVVKQQNDISEHKHAISTALRDRVWEILVQFRKDLEAEQGTTVLGAASQQPKLPSAASKPVNTVPLPASGANVVARSDSKFNWAIAVSRSELFKTLTDCKLIKVWAGKNAEWKLNGPFKLFDGAVSGQVLWQSEDLIEMQWKSDQWDSPALLTFKLEQESSSTTVTAVFKGIPTAEIPLIKQKMQTFYWERIQGIFGYQILNQ